MLSRFTPPQGIQVGPFFVYFYSVMLLIAIWIGYTLVEREAKKNQLPKGTILDLIAPLLIAGVIGARAGYVLQNLGYFLESPLDMLHLTTGGLSIHGALLVGAITLYLFTRKRKMSFLKLTDTLVRPLLTAQIIGRLGNYFNQELFGYPTDVAWKLLIDPTHRPPQYQNVSFFHPTFLYEMLLNGIGLFLLYRLKPKKEGQLTFTYLIVYGAARLITEMFRLSDRLVWHFSLAQIISLTIIIAALYLIWRSTDGRKQSQQLPKLR